ncbi:MAG: AraC family transcriptional regulator [Oscillospiraceae bacterium]|nr:AraC family transcriptional regulator [Oscillospiraceae bacterium]
MDDLIKYLPEELPDNFLSVREYGWQICAPGHSYLGKKLYYVMHYVIKGHGVFEFEKQKYHLSEGQGFIINPKDYVYYYADDEDPWVYTWVAFNGINASHLLHLSGLTESTVFKCGDDAKLKKYFYDLCSQSNSAPSPEMARIGYLYLIFSHLINHIDTSKDMKNKDFLMLAVKYMEHNFDKKISVNDIAKYFNVSRSQFYRLFKNKLNISPSEYLSDMKLSKACFYLESSDMTVYNICTAVGYSDAAHFCKRFKKKYSITPLEYRQKHKK